ncbi:MAG: hypothetical protein EAZ67_02495 [Cytophagales bacterium]|nr:MAG: hypothetical protein EAZ67_02495 [Cytophagales bacterium]
MGYAKKQPANCISGKKNRTLCAYSLKEYMDAGLITALGVLAGSVSVGGGCILWYISSLTSTYERSYNRLSDADLLRLIQGHGAPMSSKMLASLSSLTRTEAYMRLQYLQMNGAIKILYDASDMSGTSYYAVKEPLPTNLEIPNHQPISEQDIVNIAYANAGRISPAHLCVVANIPYKEAKKLLKVHVKSGLIKSHYNSSWAKVYMLDIETSKARGILPASVPQRLESSPKVQQSSTELGRLDAAVIRLAVQHLGRLTPALLCMKNDIPIDQAKEILEVLYSKGVFDMRVSDSGNIEYWLTDNSLFES